MSPLQRLVLEQMHKRGWEPMDVEKRGVAHATLHGYMNGKQLSGLPRLATRQKLADALGLNLEVVTQAAKDSVGWTSSVVGDMDADAPAARGGGGGGGGLSDYSLAELADEIRRRADEGP